MANVQIDDLTTASFETTDIIHTNKSGLDRKNTLAELITFFEASFAHDNISGSGSNSHAAIDSHINNSTIHRSINDAGSSTTDLWSANKIASAIAAANFNASAIVSGTFVNARISQSSVTQHQAAINHDALTGFVSNEHINHSSVSINTNANSGLAGGGNITASRSLVLDVNNLPTENTIASGDFIPIYDLSGGTTDKVSFATFEAGLNHDSLAGFVAKEHIDWTADAGADNIHVNNIIASAVTQHQASINHDALTNFVSNEHINHSSVSISSGEGLTGGGNITASRTLSLDINGLTAQATPTAASDYVAIYDAGLGAHRKVLLEDLPVTETILQDNAGSNIGTGGQNIFAQMNGADLEFRSVYASSNKLTIGLDGGNNRVTFDVVEGNININNLNGAGSFSAATLDGIDSSQFVRSDTADTVSGVLTFNARPAFNGGTSGSSSPFTVDSNSVVTNLNADLLDGLHSSSFLLASSYTAADVLNKIKTVDGIGSGLDADTVDGFDVTLNVLGNTIPRRDASGDIQARLFRSEYDTTNSSIGYIMTQIDTASNNYIRPSTPAQIRAGVTDGFYVDVATYTAADVLNKVKTVDGAGSGLDADLLDGLNSASFIRSDTGDDVTGHTEWQDGFEVRLGNSADLRISHSAGQNYMNVVTGDLYIQQTGTNKYLFDVSSGDFHADGDIYGASASVGSDEKLKENISKILNPLDKISLLKGVTFDWKKTGKPSAGLIAQDVQKVLPEAVIPIVEVTSKEARLNLNYNAVIGLLVESIKELHKEVERLKGR